MSLSRMTHFAVLACLLLLAACSSLPPRPPMPDAHAPTPPEHGVLAQYLVPAEARHYGESGFLLLANGTEAYATRVFSAKSATTSLDIQTYIWHADMTGLMLAHHALAAADRGVRVRILVDDMDARAKNAGFAALDVHPNIEVRLFNPFASRSGKLGYASELGTGFRRLNHRMHNKSWIVDNRIALVGGRNLGDEYFSASEDSNFVDLDLLMAGPVVREVSASFDRFWNAPSNYPIAVLNDASSANGDAELARVRTLLQATPAQLAASPYAQVLREDTNVQRLVEGDTALHWTRQWTFVSDDPRKVEHDSAQFKQSAVLATLLPAVRTARQDLDVISPYFVPGRNGTDLLLGQSKGGVDIRILTNSLAATDVAAVHGGYAAYRDDLLAGGIKLWELKPDSSTPQKFSLGGSSGSSLHTKALIIDGQQVFVGSYNLDPRSTSLNTEQGVLVTDPDIAKTLTGIFEEQLQGEHAWRVQQVDGALRWDDGTKVWTSEPEATTSRRVQAWFSRMLPVESQL